MMEEEDLDPGHFGVTLELFEEWRAPRFGSTNPQRMKSTVWEWLVRSRMSAYSARQKIQAPSSYADSPTWSFARFGQSLTELADGRSIYIAGEHEDFYDPDFNIYNDVVVTHPGKEIDFYCYPKSDFPPTDFHTATLTGETIVILGNLGNRDERKWKETQILLLQLESFEIHQMASSGTSPGWIHSHKATLSGDQKSIILTGGKVQSSSGSLLRENIEDWSLSLADWHWEKLTSRSWPQFGIRRKDRRAMYLWDMRFALGNLENHSEDLYRTTMARLEEWLGHRPDVWLLKDLYDFDTAHDELHTEQDNYNRFWMSMDDVKIRFTEEMSSLQVVIEGRLAPNRVRLIQEHLIEKLSALENSPCEMEEE